MTPDSEARHVVTCFLRCSAAGCGDRILIVRRSERVGTYQGRWSAVSGYLEADALTQALSEIREETGLTPEDVRLVRRGAPLAVDDRERGLRWVVHPLLFDLVTEKEPALDWENVEARWVTAGELSAFDTVPGLAEALARVSRHGK